MSRILVIAIDGPAGSGKSTVAKAVAAKLGLPHVDTGAVYRALTLKALNLGIAIDDAAALGALAKETEIRLSEGRVFLDGAEVTSEIRTPHVTASVSELSSHPEVRERAVALQRACASGDGVVMEGRDIGTVVLPLADLKIFLTADVSERAGRRRVDLEAEGVSRTVDEIAEEIQRRDKRDSERPASPLSVAQDAAVIDSTGKSVEDVVNEILELVRSKES
ncbi:MAG: (d)CMP kinase [Acidimicrobiia bacterium]